ncbi:MAG TPA: signal peptidase I [Actinobacteria bacterium]|nr:signal peptidase I [Actinomycetota bacterium]
MKGRTMIYIYSRIKGWWGRTGFIDKAMSMVTIAILILFLVLFALIAQGNLGLLIVKSDSMSPSIQAGSLLVFARAGIEQVEIGDTVVFREGSATNSLVTHRVIEKAYKKGEFLLRTKGDSNHRSDELLVSEAQLMGKATTVIPSAGRALAYTKTPAGLLVLNLLLVVFMVLVMFDRIRLSQRMAYVATEGALVNPIVAGEDERVSGEG